jgi:hypothetical protein
MVHRQRARTRHTRTAPATQVNLVPGYPGAAPVAPPDATTSCHQAARLTAPATSGHQG